MTMGPMVMSMSIPRVIDMTMGPMVMSMSIGRVIDMTMGPMVMSMTLPREGNRHDHGSHGHVYEYREGNRLTMGPIMSMGIGRVID